MTDISLKAILFVIVAVILVDVFCGDVTNSRQTNLQNSKISEQSPSDNLSNSKSTTARPILRQRSTISPINRGTQTPKKWIQQNNVWIKNEQASSGSVGDSKNTNLNPQNVERGPNSRSTTTAKPPLNRGDTYTVLKPQIVNNKNVGPDSKKDPPANVPTTNKPLSYAGAVGTKSPSTPNNPPQKGTSTKDNVPSAGPVLDNIEDFDGNKDVKSSTDSSVTDEDLREFSEMLLRKDSNNAMKYVTLNLQGKTISRSSSDEAPLPLLKIDEAAFKIPTIEKMMLLYNNYFLDAGQNEVYTGQERIEENNLLDALLSSPVMQFARSFLIQKGKLGRDPKEFRDLLRSIWFNMYSRGNGRIGSSGFEHVFVAEIKNNQVSGLHNWIYFNEEESKGKANYLGYMKKLDLGEKGAILKYHFTFHDIDKPVGSMFIGTSPELEIALYTTCFVLRADNICPLKMNGNRFIIRTYTFRYRGKNMIGSAFPEI